MRECVLGRGEGGKLSICRYGWMEVGVVNGGNCVWCVNCMARIWFVGGCCVIKKMSRGGSLRKCD